MSNIEKVGIVGFGAMGQLMADKMFPGAEIRAHDPNKTEMEINGIEIASLEEVAQSDVVVLAVTAENLLKVSREVATKVPEGTLLIDVCSVKMFPELVFSDLRQKSKTIGKLLCHPLFGPQSASKGLKGHRVFVTKSEGEKAEELTETWRKLGLKIIDISSEEHDKLMVPIQAIPFVIGRMVAMLGLEDPASLQTPSRLNVRKLEWLDEQHSDELFRTVVKYNPFVRIAIEEMLANGQELVAQRKYI